MYQMGWGGDLRGFEIRMSELTLAGFHRGTPDMSTLTRRACYKCGNVGHYAGLLYSHS